MIRIGNKIKNNAFFALFFMLCLSGFLIEKTSALGYYGIHNGSHGHHGGLGLGHSSNFGFHGNHHSGFGHNSHGGSYGHRGHYGNRLHSSRRGMAYYNNNLHRPYTDSRVSRGNINSGQTVIIINQNFCDNRSSYVRTQGDNVRENFEQISISSQPYVFSYDNEYEPGEKAYVFRYDDGDGITYQKNLVATNDEE